MKLHHTTTWRHTISRGVLVAAAGTGIIVAATTIYGNAQNGPGDNYPGYYGDGQPTQQDIDVCEIIRSMEVVYDPTSDRWTCERKAP